MRQDKNKDYPSPEVFRKLRPGFVKWLQDYKHSVKFDAYIAGYEAGYSQGHEDQMKMRIQDAIENKIPLKGWEI